MPRMKRRRRFDQVDLDEGFDSLEEAEAVAEEAGAWGKIGKADSHFPNGLMVATREDADGELKYIVNGLSRGVPSGLRDHITGDELMDYPAVAFASRREWEEYRDSHDAPAGGDEP